ncbi:YqgE/AlgH family protein [Kineosporia sp. A_224]|uniref:YqgE/AlgH family protein n=1 Tax=Kineosporia sp. A_224 TaxID=1962180 RepID=UPI000B4B22C2|nr:YqgE/AlgH family protein [Kineosporia sp. A_224]
MALTERLTGRLLVATPLLTDPNFDRTVVLMLDHNDEGALGIVVNRPLDVDVDKVLPVWQPHVTAPGRLFKGGPVQLDSALGVVAVPGDATEPVGVKRIIGALGLVDLDTPPEVVVGGIAGLRIFAGYAGWGAGQLEAEIDEGAWFVVDAEARDPFSDEPQRLWADVLRRQRGDLAFMATYPVDPVDN